MYRTDQFGRLDYVPFLHYALPELVRATHDDGQGNSEWPGEALFECNDPCRPMFKRPLYRLRWPGETDKPATGVPFTREMDRIPWLADLAERTRRVRDEVMIAEVLEQWHHTEGAILPVEIAYHVAVNGRRMFPVDNLYPVAGLSGERVREVLDTSFAVDGHALATLNYFKWTAVSLAECPFFRGFDTNVRETLYNLQHEAVRLYFYLLADYRYDAKTRWWARDTDRFVWQRLATYLHWVGRTGSALYGSLAHIVPAEGIRPDVVEKYMQDVIEGDLRWRHAINYRAEGVEEVPNE